MLESQEIKENEYNIAFLKQAQHAISMPNIPAMEFVWGGMEVAFTAIWNGAEEPKAHLIKALNKFEKQLTPKRNK